MILGSATWTDAADVAASSVLVIPVGSTEQHGPHLPLSTDTDIAVAVAGCAASLRPNIVVAPALPYGSSGEHAGFPGTLSIGQDAVEHIIIELVRSADRFAAVVLVSGHGGNHEPLTRAIGTLLDEGRQVTVWSPSGAVDAHAGRAETSMMLALDPGLVRLDRATAGDLRSLTDLLPALRAGGVRSVSPSGVLGDPAGASPEEGHALLAQYATELTEIIDRLILRA